MSAHDCAPVSEDVQKNSNRQHVSAVSDLVDKMNQNVGNARGALRSAADSCADLERNSLCASESSQTVRVSIAEISLQADSASQIINQIVGNVGLAQDNSGRLEKAVEKISSVVTLIKNIAKQTNLLALNATIEAARAGDVGRGFAVVANEVKALANQTSSATEDIASQVLQMQSASRETIESVRLIHTDIQGMNGRLRAIADSVGRQESSAGEVVSAIEACTTALGGLRDALGNIQKGAALNFERTAEMRTLLGKLEL
jgi:methyl-accepting chemotaxis protein